MPSAEKRGLLYGVIAYKNGFVTIDQFVDALGSWWSRPSKEESHIASYFVECGLLSTDQAEAVDRILSLHAAEGGTGEFDSSLETLASFEISDALERLENIEEVGIEKTIHQLKNDLNSKNRPGRSPDSNAGAHDRNAILGMGDRTSEFRFKVLHPLESGKGGMGEIDVAEDSELGRHVALKKIRPEQADEDGSRERFRREAEITGNLEHPSIVPIYGLGADNNGRPFYAMRWIRGKELGSQIAEFQTKRIEGQTSFDSVEFRALVDQLIDVAQAISYAHSRGVLHRDLKPGNVMVGKYGETLVIDWGLARVPEQSDDRGGDAALEKTAGDPLQNLSGRPGSEVLETVQGSMMGTLGYAPPEQLNGRVDQICPQSDVYGLGAILYQILTGKTTVATKGRGLQAAVDDTLKGKIESPNAVVSGVPKSLAAICMKALARSPQNRYASANELVEELERWKADQPVLAKKQTVVERLARFGRKHRSATVAGGLALAVIAIVSTLALIEVNRQRGLASSAANSEKIQRIAAQEARMKAEELAESERIAKEDARRLAKAEKRAKEAATELAKRNEEVVDSFVSAFRSADPNNDGATHKMTALDVLNQAHDRLEDEDELARDPLAKAHLLQALGDSFSSLGDNESAAECLGKAFEIRSEELGDEASDTLVSLNNLAVAYYYLGETQRCIALNRQLYEVRKKILGESHKETLGSLNNLAAAELAAGDQAGAAESLETVLVLLAKELGDEHSNVVATKQNLANCYRELGRYAEAVKLMQQVYDTRQRELGDSHPQAILALDNLGLVHSQNGSTQEAHKCFTQSYKLGIEKLGEDHPSTLTSLHNLAGSHEDLGEYDTALTLYQSVVAKRKVVLGEEHPVTLVSLNNLASLLQSIERLDEAKALHQEVLRLREQVLGVDHPYTLASMNNLATALQGLGELDEAKSLLQKGLPLQEKRFGTRHPSSLAMKLNLARVIESIDGYMDARGLIETVVADATQYLGEKHPVTIVASRCLASNYMYSPGKRQNAIAILEKILELSIASVGEESAQTESIVSMLAEAEELISNQEEEPEE